MPVTMEVQVLMLIAGTVAFAALAGALMRRRHRRQMQACSQRVQKVERRLEHAAEQHAKLRKQIDKLQRELSEARRAAAAAGSTRAAPATPASRNGFADTMPM